MLIAEKAQDWSVSEKKSNKLHLELGEINLYVLSRLAIFQFPLVAGFLGVIIYSCILKVF